MIVEPKDLQHLSDRELLVQLRIDMAVLKERTDGLQDVPARTEKLETDVRWIKRIVWSAIPMTPIIAGAAAVLGKLFN